MASIKKMSALLIPLILSIIVNVVMIFVAVHLNSKFEEKEQRVRTADRNFKNAQKKTTKLETNIKELSRLIEGSDRVVVSEARDNYLKPENVNRMNRIQDHTGARDLLYRKDRQSPYDHFADYIPQLYLDRIILLEEFVRQRTTLYQVKENSLKLQKENKKIIDQKNEEITDLQEREKVLIEEKEEIAKEAAEARTQYIFENQRLKQLIEETKKAHNEQVAKLESHIAERESRIRDLTKKSAKKLTSLEPDGEIILAESDLGAAWIDLGRVNNIRKGLRFKVFRYIKGGRPKEKGTIEVKNVDDNHSYCAILDTKDEKDPIVKGDYYISPLFDKNEKKIFVFAGELMNLRYSRQELKKKIEEAGAAVESSVTVKTDFLVAGKNAEADEAFTKALQFGVIIMREKDLFEYLGD